MKYLLSWLLSFALSSSSVQSQFKIQRMSFIQVPVDSDFPLENLPYGVFSTADNVSELCTVC